MRVFWVLIVVVCTSLPLLAQADPQPQTTPTQPFQAQDIQNQPAQASQGSGTQDVFSYSYLQLNHLSEHSDYIANTFGGNGRSSGNGLRFSYSFDSGVYLFGQWNRLDFDTIPGDHNLFGIGIGAHQAYNQSTSFYIDLAYLRDQLSGNLGGAKDYYWRVSYGLQSHVASFVFLNAAIFTERNTDFGRRPFGERLGLGFGGSILALVVTGEHTADGNRVEAALNWYFK